MSDASHWDNRYNEIGHDQVSWYQESAESSLQRVRSLALDPTTPCIDIGGGASRLTREMWQLGFIDLTILDLSLTALDIAKSDLEMFDGRAECLVADITNWQPERKYGLWHDRAVLHFLVSDEDRNTYRQTLLQALLPGGDVIISGFALDGPDSCSALPVRKASAEELADWLGPEFRTISAESELHLTPSGAAQSFAWLVAQRVAD